MAGLVEGGEQYDLHALVDGHDEWVCGLLGSLLLEKRSDLVAVRVHAKRVLLGLRSTRRCT